MTDTGDVTVVETTRPTGKKKRGRESALDMVRSLAVVFLLVVPLWYFGQASPSDSKRIRPINPAGALQDFVRATGGPVPTTPEGWTPNVQAYDSGVLRVGYVEHDHYAEFLGGIGSSFVEDVTGKGTKVSTVQVDGVPWDIYESGDAHESLVRAFGKVTVVVGGVRETATQDELVVLASTVR
ncbi:MAG: hypothetical protein JWO12_3593 [Frankiales bacterium]|nr:hypothetical protein [Frankiales bacterium]